MDSPTLAKAQPRTQLLQTLPPLTFFLSFPPFLFKRKWREKSLEGILEKKGQGGREERTVGERALSPSSFPLPAINGEIEQMREKRKKGGRADVFPRDENPFLSSLSTRF